MISNKFSKLSLLIPLLSLAACNHYSVETYYDEFKKTQACSLKDNLLIIERNFLLGTRRLEINLDKFDTDIILVRFSLLGISKNSFFMPNAQVLFKITHRDGSVEEIRLISTSPVQDKSAFDSITRGAISILSTEMTREQILKIANAEKVEFIVQTTDSPLRGTLDKEDLHPFREFSDRCLIKN